jgi:hypothetical protein
LLSYAEYLTKGSLDGITEIIFTVFTQYKKGVSIFAVFAEYKNKHLALTCKTFQTL